MSTLLNFVDYSEPNWGQIDLGSDWQSYRSFWTSVLQLATADQATAVHYRVESGEDCLAVEVGGKTYSMEPPPEEYRSELLHAVRLLSAGGAFQLFLKRILNLFSQSACIGAIAVETPADNVRWLVYEESRGVRMIRELA